MVEPITTGFYHAQPPHSIIRRNKKRNLAIIGGASTAILGAILLARKSSTTTQKCSESSEVNEKFIQELKSLVKICFPKILCRETFLIMSLSGFLVARTYLDIWFSNFNSNVVGSIIKRNRNAFLKNAFLVFGVMMWPMSIVNNAIKLLISSLSLAFRSRLTAYFHDLYLKDIIYYKTTCIDKRIHNPDQLIAQDIEKFSETLSHLYTDLTKPLVDIALFALKLSQTIDRDAPLLIIGYFVLSSLFLRQISPPFGKYTGQEQALEGDFRYRHARLTMHAEEIAFYDGAPQEKRILNEAFANIKQNCAKIFKLKFVNGIVDSILVKYCATQMAYWLLSRPAFATEDGQPSTKSSSSLMEDYSKNSSYMVNLSQAIGRLVLAGREITRLAGYSSRLSYFLQVLKEIALLSDHSKRSAVTASFDNRLIQFRNVPIATPNGDVLIKNLNLEIKQGMNVLVTGPNGCGKSSLFRVLGDLWSISSGAIVKPTKKNMFYVPQKPYLSKGTLRDQIIYPISHEEFAAQHSDEEIAILLNDVKLSYLLERERGLDASLDWTEVFSGGEKQRIAMARMFFHRPSFAILDESTSAVSVDVEDALYTHAKALGITLFTVSHRPSLFKFHDYLLRFDGSGGYTFGRLNGGNHPFAFAAPYNTKK